MNVFVVITDSGVVKGVYRKYEDAFTKLREIQKDEHAIVETHRLKYK